MSLASKFTSKEPCHVFVLPLSERRGRACGRKPTVVGADGKHRCIRHQRVYERRVAAEKERTP